MLATLSYLFDLMLAKISREEDLFTIAENLLNDDMFLVLDPLYLLQVRHPLTNVWNPLKVKRFEGTLRANKSTKVEVLSTNLLEEPFPKLIGRKSLHPLNSAAQLL